MIQAALALLETGGPEAVSTRLVSAAADVQPPTIYRHFGDMQGLLNAVARAGFTAYLESKAARTPTSDPVEELREGWNLHVDFGLTHPHLYTLMYASTKMAAGSSSAAVEAFSMLRALLWRVAEVGRLTVSVERAVAMIHGGALGVTLSLLNAKENDTKLSDTMREAVLNAILTPESETASQVVKPQAAAHAVSLVALLPDLEAPFTNAERALLSEWLQRLI